MEAQGANLIPAKLDLDYLRNLAERMIHIEIVVPKVEWTKKQSVQMVIDTISRIETVLHREEIRYVRSLETFARHTLLPEVLRYYLVNYHTWLDWKHQQFIHCIKPENDEVTDDFVETIWIPGRPSYTVPVSVRPKKLTLARQGKGAGRGVPNWEQNCQSKETTDDHSAEEVTFPRLPLPETLSKYSLDSAQAQYALGPRQVGNEKVNQWLNPQVYNSTFQEDILLTGHTNLQAMAVRSEKPLVILVKRNPLQPPFRMGIRRLM